MKLLLAPGLLAALSLVLVACTPSPNSAKLGAEPGWFADAARREREPVHYRPDPSRVNNEGGAGPAILQLTTDRRSYPEPPAKRSEGISSTGSLGDRGRDARIRRVVR